MKPVLLRLLKIMGIIIALLLTLLFAVGFLLNTNSLQNRLAQWATEALSEKLHATVTIDHVDIDFCTYDVRLHGLAVEDLQQQKMLQMEQLVANVQLLPLLHNEVNISSVRISGLQARLYQLAPDSAANYQFLIDAFKKEKSDTITPDSIPAADSTLTARKKPLKLDLKEVVLERVALDWTHFKKKGPEDVKASLQRLSLRRRGDDYHISIQKLCYANDNRLPRRNAGNPKRGAFDAAHLNITANAELILHLPLSTLHPAPLPASTPAPLPASTPAPFPASTPADLSAGSFSLSLPFSLSDSYLELTHLDATDSIAGLHLDHLSFLLTPAKTVANSTLSTLHAKLTNTSLSIDTIWLQLPNKKHNIPLAYATTPIRGTVLLSDIAKPFAPVLSKFSIPLSLQVSLSGDAQSMRYRNIRVATLDKKFQLSANGRLTNLTDKNRLALHFHVDNMKAAQGIKERIISQFPVKKLMMKELHSLGTITYRGDISIRRKREEFSGILNTQVGRLDFRFHLDELNKYVVGTAATSDLLLGPVFDIDNLGKIVASAQFKIDISKPRTALMRRQKGGKLPIGTVTAHVDECSWKKIKVRNLDVEIVSDGAQADGDIAIKGKRTDLLCSFSLIKTDSVKNKLKVKPGIRFHALSDDDKAEKAARKARKAEQKAQEKARKEAEKALKAEQKAQEKARKAEEKARQKALRAQQKAEDKARKDEQKARKGIQ